ncbi:MAG: DUF86 domain-containing protein [Syntrophales bacterium]|nr:DUF86 domain-containing protein [Syntrophales bacterium]
MVDKTLILRKLAELEELLTQVKEYENVAVEQYQRDWRIQRIVERTLQMMIETCADIAEHIISDRGYRIPTSYSDTFRVLHENRILKSDLFETMEKMAKFRNIIVHQYDRVDAEIVIGILRKNLNDFLNYKDAIINMLKTDETP